MKKQLSRKLVRNIICISIVYFLVHGLMVFVTGTFHDDWLSFFHDTLTKNMEGIESGRPYYSFVIEGIWYLPYYGYRILAFVTYWISYVFIFLIACQVFGEGRENDAFAITVLTISMPVNDARLLLANYPYALGMMFFFFASFVLVIKIKSLTDLRFRVVIEILYLLSFTLNSNLVLYSVILLYLAVKIKPSKYYQLVDFVLLPVMFYCVNKVFWPVYGSYAEYNIVNWERIKWTISNIPQICGNILSSVETQFLEKSFALWIAVLAFLIVFIWDYRKTNLKNSNYHKEKTDVAIFYVGVVFFIAGWFPYIVIRQTTNLSLTGIQGRDSMQIGIGLALMLYGIITAELKKAIVVFTVVLGLFHFNIWYMNYQTEWYRQLAFQKQVSLIDDVYDGGNFIVNCSQQSPVLDRRFYTWSGNVVAATGVKNIFVLNGENDIALLKNQAVMESILCHYPMYTDYHYNDEIRGTLDFHINLSNSDALRLKLLELFDQDKFEERISKIGTIQYEERN